MAIRCNFHTHTTFCDGADTPEEMVIYAIENGCRSLGFSGHAPSGVRGDYGFITSENITSYANEVIRLKDLYNDQIELYLGIEQDYFSPTANIDYDYVIGSVHYVKKGDCFIPMDISYEALRRGIDECFGGDAYEMARAYYETLADIPRVTGCQIIGHADLLTKFNKRFGYIDESNKKYRNCALDAIDALLEKDVVFEVNTGAMKKGWKTCPYPADFMIKHINERGGRLMLSSDCHAKENLFSFFDESEKRLSSFGVKELYVLNNGEFSSVKI